MNASIWRMLEGNGISPTKTVNSRYFIIENITESKSKKSKVNEVADELSKHDKDLRLLSYKILLEKFNNKYGAKLGVSQKRLLRAYIENISNTNTLREVVSDEIEIISKAISLLNKKIKDKVVNIKLNEVKTQLVKIKSLKSINETHILSCMRSHSLIKELKNVTK